MEKFQIFAQNDIETEGATHPGHKKGSVVATIETELPLDRLLSGLQLGHVAVTAPKEPAKESAKEEQVQEVLNKSDANVAAPKSAFDKPKPDAAK